MGLSTGCARFWEGAKRLTIGEGQLCRRKQSHMRSQGLAVAFRCQPSCTAALDFDHFHAVLFLVGRVEARIADADLVAKDSARRGPPGSPSEPSHSIDQGIAERSSRVNSGTTVFTRM